MDPDVGCGVCLHVRTCGPCVLKPMISCPCMFVMLKVHNVVTLRVNLHNYVKITRDINYHEWFCPSRFFIPRVPHSTSEKYFEGFNFRR